MRGLAAISVAGYLASALEHDFDNGVISTVGHKFSKIKKTASICCGLGERTGVLSRRARESNLERGSADVPEPANVDRSQCNLPEMVQENNLHSGLGRIRNLLVSPLFSSKRRLATQS